MPGFDYTAKTINNDIGLPVTVVVLSGTIDPTSVESFEEVFKGLLDREQYNIVLDLKNLQYLNSTAMGLMVRWADKFAEKHGKLVLLQLSPKVKVMIEMLGLKEFFEITTEEKTALAAFIAREEEPENETIEIHLKDPEKKADSVPIKAATAPAASKATAAVTEAVCGQCGISLTMAGSGRYRCPRCRAFLVLNEEGMVETKTDRTTNEIELILPAKADYLKSLEQIYLAASGQAGIDKDTGISFFKAVESCGNYLIKEALGGSESERIHILLYSKKGAVSSRIFATGKVLPLEGTELSSFEPLSSIAGSLDRFEYRSINNGNFFILEKHID